MSKLLDKIRKAQTIKETAILESSILFTDVDETPTDILALNIALSGCIDGGLKSGILTLAGKSRHFKSLYALLMASAYLRKHKESVLLFYDSEFGSPISYFKSVGIDPARVIHTPVKNLEELKFDIMQQLDSIDRGDKLFILIDSIGNIASVKEADNAIEQKSAADMTRAKETKSLFRIITPYLRLKDIPLVQVGHTYDTLETYQKTILSGGTSLMLASDGVIFITRQQDKGTDGLDGYFFTLNTEKSRYVKEKSKIPINVKFEGGVSRFAGMLDIALDIGAVQKPSNGWYSRVDMDTGEVESQKFRAKDTDTESFWKPLITSDAFKKKIRERFQVSIGSLVSHSDITEEDDDPSED